MPSSTQLRGGVKEGAAKEGKSGGKADNRADWNEARNWFFVTILKEYNSPKYRGQNGWTKESWNSMTQRVNEKFPSANFVVQKLKDREQRLKKEYNAVKDICSKSGFGWDNNLKMATTIDGLWSDLPENLRKWQNKSFPYYDDLHEIYSGKTAEGKRCRRSSEKANITDNKIQEEDYDQMSPISPAIPVMQDSFLDLLPNSIDLNTESGMNFDIHDSQYRAMAEEQANRDSQCYSQTQEGCSSTEISLLFIRRLLSRSTPARMQKISFSIRNSRLARTSWPWRSSSTCFFPERMEVCTGILS